uniref:CSON009123 protein n=1 Tax=Culicoides sonorensis TaxID=179676 RepID=A0A336N2A4_CULSO
MDFDTIKCHYDDFLISKSFKSDFTEPCPYNFTYNQKWDPLGCDRWKMFNFMMLLDKFHHIANHQKLLRNGIIYHLDGTLAEDDDDEEEEGKMKFRFLQSHIHFQVTIYVPGLGEGYKQVRVGQLSTSLGTLNMAVAYRTKMTITPTQTIGRDSTTLLLKSTDPHWNLKDLKNGLLCTINEKKVIDIDKPMRRGAFVDESFAKQYTEADFSLPETPPFSWLLRKPTTTTSSSLAQKDDGGASDLEDILATSPPSDENSATALNTTGTSSTTTTTNNNNASVKSLENPKSSGAASPKSSNEQLTGTSPSSLNEFKRSSSRWSTRTLPGEDEKLFKELHFPFATQNTPISDLAKFYRECFNAPPLQQFAEIDNPTATGTGTVLSGSGDDAEATSATSSSSCRLGANNADFVARNSSIDDLTKQLEEFETSLGDYDTLVTSLCQQSSEVDNNSNS